MFPKDASEHFYKAQFNIGGAYYKLGETDEAVAVWKNIPESAAEQYEMAQTKPEYHRREPGKSQG